MDAVIFLPDRDGDTLLHIAIILGKQELAVLLVSIASSYALLSRKNILYQTPLHLATLTNQPKIVRRLIIGGADLESRDKDGNTALHIACRDGHISVVKCLLEPLNSGERTQIPFSAPHRCIPQDFTIPNYEGMTCLHLAAANGHLDIVQELMNKGINLNLKDGKAGRTVLHSACVSGDIKLARLLLGHGTCNINARAYDGRLPLDFACSRGHDDVCSVLAAAGARSGGEYSDSE